MQHVSNMLQQMQVKLLQAAAQHSAERLADVLNFAVVMQDWDTADYIADNMLASLPRAVQQQLVDTGVVQTVAQ